MANIHELPVRLEAATAEDGSQLSNQSKVPKLSTDGQFVILSDGDQLDTLSSGLTSFPDPGGVDAGGADSGAAVSDSTALSLDRQESQA